MYIRSGTIRAVKLRGSDGSEPRRELRRNARCGRKYLSCGVFSIPKKIRSLDSESDLPARCGVGHSAEPSLMSYTNEGLTNSEIRKEA